MKPASLRAKLRVLALECRVQPATLTWQGDMSADWSNAGNWLENQAPTSGDTLVFDTAASGFASFTSNNNITGLRLAGLQIVDTSAGGDFNLTGNGITVAGPLTHNQSAGTQTSIGFSTITLDTDVSFTSSAGSLLITSPVELAGATLTVGGAGNVTLAGNVTGSAATAAGFRGDYFSIPGGPNDDNIDPTKATYLGLLTPTATARTLQINFPDTGGNPYAPAGVNVGTDNVAGRWTGTLTVPTTGDYTFFTTSDDGSVLYIDGNLVVNNKGFHGMVTQQGTVTGLTAGTHAIEVMHYEGSGGAGMIVEWTPAGGSRELLPASVISVAGTNKLVKTGTGTLTLSGNNSFVGDVAVQQGTLVVASGSALGTTAAGTSVASGATLAFSGGAAVGAEALGLAAQATVRNVSGTNSFAGAVTLAPGGATVDAVAGLLTLSGPVALGGNLVVTGAGNVTVAGDVSGAGTTAPGLVGSYFGGVTADDSYFNPASPNYLGDRPPTVVAQTGVLNFPDTGGNVFGPAGVNVGTDNVAGRWVGFVEVPATGPVTFFTTSDDGSVLLIDGQLVVNNGGSHGMETRQGTVTLTSGKHLIEIMYYEGTGGAGLIVDWDIGAGQTLIPASAFSSPANSIVQQGTGTLELGGANTFDGTVDVQSGTVRVTSTSALGSTASGTTVAAGATLEVAGDHTSAEPVTLTGGTLTGTGTGSFAGPVTVSKASTISAAAGADFTLAGTVTADAAATISAGTNATLTFADTVTLNKASTVTAAAGGDVVFDGNLAANANTTIGGAGDVTVNGVLSGLPNQFVSGGLTGNYYSGITSTAALLNPIANLQALTPAATVLTPRVDFGDGTETVPGDGSVLDRGGGTSNHFGGLGVNLGSNDNIAGLWFDQIYIAVAGDYRFTTRSDDGSVLLIDGVQIVDNNFDQGMTNRSGTVTLTAGYHDIVIGFRQGGGGWGVQASWELLTGPTFARRIIEPDVLGRFVSNTLTYAGTGTLRLNGANTYQAAIAVSSGTLVAGSPTALGTTAAGTTVAAGATLALTDGLFAAEPLSLAGTISGVGTDTDFPGPITLTASATIAVGAGNALALTGPITDGTNTFGVTKTGAGTLTLATTTAYDGPTAVSGGTLLVTGNATSTPIVVAAGATLAGTGTTGTATAQSGSTVAPGGASGGAANLNVFGNFALTGGSTFAAELGGTSPGTQYDRLRVAGGVTLGGALSLALTNGFTPTVGQTFTLIDNDGTDAVTGTFAQGSTITLGARTFAISYTGGDGNDVTLTLTAVTNAPPVNTVPGAQTTNEDTPLAFTGPALVSVADPDAGTNAIRTTVSIPTGRGTLSVTAVPGLTVTGSGTNSVQLDGTAAAINAGLTSLVYTPSADGNSTTYGGTVTLTVLTTDLGNTGSDGAKTDSDTVAIAVTPVNDDPSLTLPTPIVTVNEDAGPQSLAGFAANLLRGPATATDETGQTLAFTVAVIGTTGTLAFTSAPAISPTGVLTFTAAPDTNGTATVTVFVTDSAGGVSATLGFQIVVTAVNDAPAFALPLGNPPTVTEDAGPQTVSGFAAAITRGPVTATDEASQTITFRVVQTGGTNGLAFSAVPTIDPLTGTLTYTPAANSFGTAVFSVVAVDNGSGVAPNANASAAQTFTIAVLSADDAPTAANDTFSTLSGVPIAIPAPGLLANDTDPDSVSLTVVDPASIALTQGFGTLTVDANGGVVFTPTLGFVGTASFDYRITDGTSPSNTATVTITVSRPGGPGGGTGGAFAPPAFALGSDAGRPGQATAYDSFGRPLFAVVPYGPAYSGGVRVATGDVDGDGVADVVTGPGVGVPSRVVVFDGQTRETLRDTTVFEATFTGGVFLSAADLNGDGKAEVIVSADVGGGPRVVVLDGATGAVLVSFLGIDDANFRGGARTAAGDFNRDGVPDLVVAAGAGGGPRVAVFDGRSVAAGNPTRIVEDFYAFEQTVADGVFPAAGDMNGDGVADFIFGGGPGGGPRVRIADGATVLSTPGFLSLDNLLIGRIANFFAGDPANRDGARIVARDLDGDTVPELITASGSGGRAVAYRGANIPPQSAPQTLFELTPFPDFLGGVFVG